MKEYEFHEAANILPLDEEHLDELIENIHDNDQYIPIDLLDGKILDGRRRWLACKKLGIEPKVREAPAKAKADPLGYVLSLNLHRRHLSPTQLAMVGARAREWYKKKAKERQQEHGDTAPGRRKSLPVNLPEVIAGDARDQAGKAVGVSGKSIDHATAVLEKGTPDLIAAVDDDLISVSTARRATCYGPSEQDAMAARARENAGKGKRRRYRPADEEAANEKEENEQPNGKLLGKGIILAKEAINCLKRIPKNDALRKRGFQLVMDFIRHNK